MAKSTANSVVGGFCMLLTGIGVGWLIGLSVSPVIYVVITSLVAFVVSVSSALAGIKVNEGKEGGAAEGASRSKLQVEVNPIPMTLLVVGMAAGASFGVYGRTNGWLGPDAGKFVENWKGTGLDGKDISRRLFDTMYPPAPQPSPQKEVGGAADNNNQSTPAAAGDNEPAADENSDKPTPTPAASPDGATPKRAAALSAPSKPKPPPKGKPESPPKSTAAPASDLTAKVLSGVLFTATDEACARYRTTADEGLNEALTNQPNKDLERAARMCGGNVGCLKQLVRKVCPRK